MTAGAYTEAEYRSPFWAALRTAALWAPITGYLALWWLLAGAPTDERGVLMAAPPQWRLLLAWALCVAAQAALLSIELWVPRRGRRVRDIDEPCVVFAVIVVVDAAVLGGFWLMADMTAGLGAIPD